MAKITHISQLDLTQTYSYADYLSWQLDEFLELIKGRISLMSPAPNVKHQTISMNISRLLSSYFMRKQCRVYAAPFDVRLYDRNKSILASQDIHTVVQPDLCVICNLELLDEQGCNGAPDWMIEIVSKGTRQKDIQIKYQLYQEAGVTEYWLVYPEEQMIHQFILDENSRYQLTTMAVCPDALASHLFPELMVDLREVFEVYEEE